MGIKRPTTLSFSSHTFCWSHLRFSVFFSPKTIQWVLRHFLRARKEQSVILCNNNNNKKNYCPLSRKKGKKVSLRISVRWPAEAAGVSVKVRDANTHWRRAWELQQHLADRGPMGAPKHPVSEPWMRLSAMLEVNPYSLSPADLALLFSSHRLLKLTAADDGFWCSEYEKH